jgi:hypothetical protein
MFSGKSFGDFGLISAILFLPNVAIFAAAYFIAPMLFGNTENKFLILKSGVGLACPASSMFLLVYQEFLLVPWPNSKRL